MTKKLNATYLNADQIRKLYNDWDFSIDGRIRQSQRMRRLAEESITEFTVVDFVCPLQMTRDYIAADYTIWMNTIESGRYKDTNELFERPKSVNIEIKSFDYNIDDINIQIIAEDREKL